MEKIYVTSGKTDRNLIIGKTYIYFIIVSIVNIVFNVFGDINFLVNIKWLVLLVYSLSTYYFVKHDINRKLFTTIALSICSFYLLPMSFLEQGGVTFLNAGYLVTLIILVSFLTNRKTSFVLGSATVLIAVIMMYIQNDNPEYFARYVIYNSSTDGSYIFDEIIQVIMSCGISAIVSISFSNLWDLEKRNVEKYVSLLNAKYEEISWISTHDELTRLYNRSFIDGLPQLIEFSKECYVIISDIDNFKKVNDTFGHLRGDEVLVDVAALFNKYFEDSAYIVRFGGDEILMVTMDISLLEIEDKLAKLSVSIGQIKTEGVNLSISGGVVKLEDKTKLIDYINQADIKLYESKNSGKGCYNY